MVRPVIAGVDGSPESLAAAEWAGREAARDGLPLRLLCAGEPPEAEAPSPRGAEARRRWAEDRLLAVREHLAEHHPGLETEVEQVRDLPAPALLNAARDARMVVLGSRGLSGFTGFLLGSVGLAVVAGSPAPVVLVRAGEDAHVVERGIVVLGLDLRHDGGARIDFAFRAAAARGAVLRVVHGWNPRLAYGYAAEPLPRELEAELEAREVRSVAEAVRPGRAAFPDVPVVEQVAPDNPAQLLVAAAAAADLLVVGRREHRSALGPRMGHVTHAVLHHAACPVAVVPHD
ncbi:universal stress protein [Wenjunlia tyrosinilytica]|uniref:Universal stress protein n=1 Tax=Wenjunlia tyrosinilytica TaxID=1544741 RepID=A0A917ZMU1_9ACTN|nr:universal stress protein [Wenjunlia tyrosinilytica]GGO87401.1 universal stress protein [Wenjunlia tyrosinilytica]